MLNSQSSLGSVLQNVQTIIWCIMSSALIGYLVLLQITKMIKDYKQDPSYKKRLWISFGVVISMNIVLIQLMYLGFKDLQKTYAKSGVDPFNLEFEVILVSICYIIIPLLEVIIFQDRQFKARYLLIPILFLVLISVVSTIFNLMVYGFGQSFFVFLRHLAYFALTMLFSQINLNTLSPSLQ